MDISKFSVENENMPWFDSSSLMHAYIAAGPECDTKRAFINTMAAAMICSSNGKIPCGKCRDCMKAFKGYHPDIIEITRQKDKKEITVDIIRSDIRKQAVILPNEAEKKVFIIREAEKMNTQGQNALLKTLEEPPKHCRFILSVENPALLLTTVKSRCAFVRVFAEKTVNTEGVTLANEMFTAISEGELNAAKFFYSLEKIDRETMADFLYSATEISLNKLREGYNITSVQLILSAIQKAVEYQKFNINSAHIAGMLASELAVSDLQF